MNMPIKPFAVLPGWLFALLAAGYLAVAGNLHLVGEIGSRTDVRTLDGAIILGTTVVLLVGLQLMLLSILGGRRLLKPLVIVFAVTLAVVSYFDRSLGVIFDTEMMRNVVDTIRERNRQEAMDLASWPLFSYVLLFCLPPAVLCMLVDIRPVRWLVDIRNRAVTTVLTIVVLAAIIAPAFRDLSYFWRENRDLRVHAIPLFPILSAGRLARHSYAAGKSEFHAFESAAAQSHAVNRRVVGVLVVGETARADHFSMNGYARDTNAYLAGDGVVNFSHAVACGTSTAYSVPCMFSLKGRDGFDPDAAEQEFNVLDVLAAAGVDIAWIDANSGCKGVCRRVTTIDLNERIPAERLEHQVYDEDLVPFIEKFADGGGDALLVMHMIGSHGPAYSARYPDRFARFRPFCTSAAPQECSQEEVVNAYDNTIAYTDYVLHTLIGELRAREDEYDSFLLYVSDHGESLGENGVYLHGWPYSIAPREQTEIPMLVWLSTRFAADHSLSMGRLRARAASPVSHDNVSHSLLGLFDVEADVYEPGLDIFRPADAGLTIARAAGGGR
ncbi:MAG: phosphoethanolamine--lipid A transferase [Gammaproteobacteria bacterium]|nr:phosphoethanolamine--lipid A transferase [Gammaproteobacteria bacterium]MDH4254134.1 phosphoethanolamine--lipid A transferase [Gammaproteobacteria bacterium]MDH5309499.1 phosphoethanolamine--lipid A transferase [Gammaproteobacteria bacterium]